MYISNLSFQLKPSKVAWFFQFGLCSVLMLVGYLALVWFIWVLFSVAILLAWYVFRKQRKVIALAQLEHAEWTVKYVGLSKPQHVNLEKLLDHALYIVLYWQEQQPPCIVWRDQLTLQEWKQLKVLAKLYRKRVTEVTG